MSRIVVLAGIFGAFILFGIFGAAASFGDLRTGLQSVSWPSTEGRIIRSVRRRGNTRLKSVEYEYRVDGVTYAGSRVAFMRIPYSEPPYKTYRTGQAVTVRYDPDDHALAVLEPGAPTLAVISEFFVPSLLIGIGASGLFFGSRR